MWLRVCMHVVVKWVRPNLEISSIPVLRFVAYENQQVNFYAGKYRFKNPTISM